MSDRGSATANHYDHVHVSSLTWDRGARHDRPRVSLGPLDGRPGPVRRRRRERLVARAAQAGGRARAHRRSSATGPGSCTRPRCGGSPPRPRWSARERRLHPQPADPQLEVAQVGRDLARALGCDPDVVETACLAHDLGHPPFGHNGERALAELGGDVGGFEGNAQTLRLLTRLEAKTFDADGRSVGLNLTRATLDAARSTRGRARRRCPPAARRRLAAGGRKFGVYDDDLPVFDWLRDGRRRAAAVRRGAGHGPRRRRRLLRARRRGRRRRRPDRPDRRSPTPAAREVWATVRDWYLPDAADDELDGRARRGWPRSTPGRGRRTTGAAAQLAGAQEPHQPADRPVLRRRRRQADADAACRRAVRALRGRPRRCPSETGAEIAVLKGIAAHLVMKADDRVAAHGRTSASCSPSWSTALADRGPDALEPVVRRRLRRPPPTTPPGCAS